MDYPSRHEDGKLPILDLKVWMEIKRRQDEREEEGGVNVILHEFYSKDVASKCVINARSALPWNSKRTIRTQEVLRILLNCSRELPWATIISHVNNMMLRLQYSGQYDQRFIAEVVRSALKAYNRLLELDASGEQPLYRPREWRQLERAQERRRKRESWYRTGGFDAVIFVPATPQSQLKDRYVRAIKDAGFKIKVVEQSGITLKRMLQRSDPFKEKNCRNINCLSAALEEMKDRYVRAIKDAGGCRTIRYNPQENVTEVRPVQGKELSQHQLSCLWHWRKRILPQYRCYL